MAYEVIDEDGLFHCIDGPARILSSGTQEWFHHGALHRIDGPAIVRLDESEEWWIGHIRHRIDGPAYISYRRIFYMWVINGIDITSEVEYWIESINVSWPWDKDIQVLFEMRFL